MANIPIDKIAPELNQINKETKELTNNLSNIIKQLDGINKSIAKSKGLKDVNENLNKVKKEQNEIEKAGNSLLAQRNKAVALQDERLRQLTKDTIKEKQAVQELNKQIKAEGDAYKQLNLQYQKAAANAKKLAAEYGVNSKQAKSAAAEANKLNNRLKSIDKTVGQSQRSVGNYGKIWEGVKGKFLAFTGALFAGRTIIKGVQNLISSTQATGDRFDQVLQGMRASYDAFNKSLATGDLKNVFRNMKEAFNAGVEFAKVLDDLGDRQRDLSVTTAEAQVQIEKLTTTVQNVTLSEKERILAAKEIFEIEKNLLTQTQSVRQQEFEAHRDRIATLTGLDKKRVLEFVKNYDEESGVREEAIKLIEQEDILRTKIQNAQIAINKGTNAIVIKNAIKTKNISEKALNDLLSTTDKNVQQYAKLYRSYAKTTDEELDNVVKSYVSLQEAESRSIAGLRRITNQYNTLLKQITKNAEDETNKTAEVIGSIPTKAAKLIDTNKPELELKVKQLQDGIAQEFEEWNKDNENNLWQNILALDEGTRQQFLSTFNELGNTLFDLGQSRRDRELESIRANYDAQIQAASGNAELQEKLQKELAVKQAQIQREQAVSERNQAIFNTIISTSRAVAQALPNIPLSVLVGTLGAAQLTAILSQPLPEIPAFFKGTESAPAGLAWVAERGRELIEMPSGQSMLVEKPSLMNMQGGEKVHTNRETEQLLNKAIYNEVAYNRGSNIDTDKIVKAIKNKKESYFSWNEKGFRNYVKNGTSITRYLDKKGRR